MTDPAIILFDGVCNLCNGAVQFVLRRDPNRYFKFASLQSDIARQLLAGQSLPGADTDSIVLLENGAAYVRSTAALRIMRKIGALWPLLYAFIIIPRPLRDGIYNWIARNRYRWFGKRDACMIPEGSVKDRFLA